MAQEPPIEDSKKTSGDSDGGIKRRPPAKKWMGCLGLFNVVVYTVMLAVCALVLMPESTKDLAGDGSAVSNVMTKLDSAISENLKSVELTQNEINAYIEDTILMEVDKGLAGSLTEYESVQVRLDDGFADVVMRRRVAGLVSTISIRLDVELEKKRVVVTIPSARFGSLPVPSGLSRFVMPAYESLKTAYGDEIKLMLKAKKITFEKGKVVFLLHTEEN